MMTLMLVGTFTYCFGQQKDEFEKWNWLMGEWVGEGSGQPGSGGGGFSFTQELDKKILVRKAHTEFPAAAGRPASVHDDLMVVYLDYRSQPTKAIYFDNEGHTINYSISYSDRSIILISEKIPNVPIFRLTYTFINDQSVNTKFEMSQDGEKFMTYIEGKSLKKK
jgi:hypothetical protein